MISDESRKFLRKILELFSEASNIPIALYELDNDKEISETIRVEKNFPTYCKEVWSMQNGQGKDLCIQNMQERAKKAFDSGQEETLLCHAGLTNVSEPIIVNGKSVA